MQDLLPDVVVHETHRVSLCDELSSRHKRIFMVDGYVKDLTNHKTVKIGGWALVRGWALARDNTVVHVPYSLDITPPSSIRPPYYLHKFAVEVYLSPIYTSLVHTWKS